MAARRIRPATFAALLLALILGACVPRIDLPGPPTAQPRLTGEALIAADGSALPIQHWAPNPNRPRAVILGLHGMNDYANAFALPGAWWAKHGIATYAYDQRGFGRSPHPGHWPGVAALTRDLDEMVALLRARYPDTPLYLVGESMGGAVAMTAMARPDHPRVDGVILAAPAVWGRSAMDLGKRLALWGSAHTVPWLRLSGRGLHIMPSDNIPMLIALGRDPLVIRETRIDAIWGVVNLMDDALAAAPKLDGFPLFILYGERDQIIPRDPTLDMIMHLPPYPTAPRKIAIYPKGYHMLLRDLEAKTVWEDVLHWIEHHRAPLPSGADKTGIAALADKG
jgi:acylglycerol lipase